MAEESKEVDIAVLSEILAALNRLEPAMRQRVLTSIGTLYGIESPQRETIRASNSLPQTFDVSSQRVNFSEDRSLSPKEFVWQKKPKNGIERVVCLAYYLEHFRGTPHFKTGDIAALNTEAAQVKFSNAAMTVSEATRAGYLATVKGQEKQLTIIGEQFVLHLPDREAALEAVKHAKPKRAKRRTPRAGEQDS
jgi:hypothetical protein